MRKSSLVIVNIVLILFFIGSGLNAQSVAYLNFFPDARSAALGGANFAAQAGAYSVFNNMSGVPFSNNKVAAAVSYIKWQPDMSDANLISASVSGKVADRIGLGFGVRYIKYQSYDVFGGSGHSTGTFSPKDFDVDFGFAYKISGYVTASATMRYVNSDIGAEKKAAAFAADISLMFNYNSLNIAVGYENAGTKLDYGGTEKYDLPGAIRLGCSYSWKFNNNVLVPLFEIDYYTGDNSCITAGIGSELKLINMFSIRAGYHFGDNKKSIPNYASAGLGFSYTNISINATYIFAGSDSPMRKTMGFSLGYNF